MHLYDFSQIIGIGLLLGQIVFILGWIGFLVSKKLRNFLLHLFPQEIWIWISLGLILGSIGGSLIYSNIYHLPICPFCWYQRMCIYPQAVILGVALWKKEYSTALYSSLILSLIGILVAAYHYSLNVKKLLYPDMDFTPCDPSGVSCSDIPLLLYGYITIPFMTIVILALVISTILLALHTRK